MSVQEDTVSPHENTTSPHDPDHGLSATRMGYFGILAEVVVALLVLFVGVRFLMAEGRPDFVAWIAFGLVVVLLVDLVRRILRAVRRNRRAQA
ncbi:MAG TPA: hypothetical protein VIG71_11115 [Enteractinococcus sp.]